MSVECISRGTCATGKNCRPFGLLCACVRCILFCYRRATGSWLEHLTLPGSLPGSSVPDSRSRSQVSGPRTDVPDPMSTRRILRSIVWTANCRSCLHEARNSCLLVKMAVQRLLKSGAASQLVSLFFVIHHGTGLLPCAFCVVVVNRCPLVLRVQQGRVEFR